MKYLTLCLSILIFNLGISNISAQSTQPTRDSLRTGTLENQFEYLFLVSEKYNQFKVVEIKNLDQLKVNVLDSVATLRGKYESLKTDMGMIEQLKADLAVVNQELEEEMVKRNTLDFFGVGIYKSVFVAVVWLLLIGTGLFLFVFFSRFQKSFSRVKEAEKTLFEVQEEFEKHRRNALERERKLKRELIDAQMNRPDPS